MKPSTVHSVETRITRGGTAATCKLTLDWTDVSIEQLQMLAAKTVIIKWQQPRTKCKTIAELTSKFGGERTVRVAGMEWGRQRVSKEAKADNLLSSMDDAELKRVLAKFNAKVNND